jgi:gamma-glutamylcyclotransferase (GGCT)/AIG2-like uncharacterized protein YtfP
MTPMPLLFSYGTLQQEEVQQSAFGRRLSGRKDALPEYEPAFVKIEDPQMSARLGRTHHANVLYNGNAASLVQGTVFDVTDAELARSDKFEAEFSYVRVMAPLASGRESWVYVHAPAAED